MYDLHTHTYNSDGVLGPSELARRYYVKGCRGVAISDHCDCSNLMETIERTNSFCMRAKSLFGKMQILSGCELTHCPPAQIENLIDEARKRKTEVVLVHGETVAEPVAKGTNRAAIEGGADVLAHPGLITEADVKLAADMDVMLEISARKGHSLTNGHVARVALKYGCKLSFGSDGHVPGDYPDPQTVNSILTGAGLTESQAETAMQNTAAMFNRDALNKKTSKT